MKTADWRQTDAVSPKTQAYNGVIYLYGRRPGAQRTCAVRGKRCGDLFWNVFFGVMCLSVLAVLFLH
jgi:hypothetical protein